MFFNSLSYFLIIVVSLVEVHSQLCNTRTIVTSKVFLTYTKLSPWGTEIAHKWVTKSEPKEIPKCCDGYTQIKFYSWMLCKQNVCKTNCENGYCEKPEVCTCNAGYKKLNNTCVPVCKLECLFGICVAPNKCLCLSGYEFVNGTCLPICRNPCGNGTCMSPDNCYCYLGFRRHYGHEIGPVCVPIIKDTTTTTINPLITMSTYYEYHTEDTATTTKDPIITMTTYSNYKYHTEDTTTSTTTTPYVVSSSASSSSTETVLDNDANNNVTSTDMIQKSWMQKHGMYIWIPVLLILSTVLILLLVWEGAPLVVINFYKRIKNRRSYNVQGAFRKQNGSDPFERTCLEFMPDEREAQS